MAGQTIVPSGRKRALCAMASSVDTPTAGMSSPQQRPLAVEMPMRMPVNEPGPCATAIASMAFFGVSVFESMFSIIGRSVRLWVKPVRS